MNIRNVGIFRHLAQADLHTGITSRCERTSCRRIQHIDRTSLNRDKAAVLFLVQLRDASQKPLCIFTVSYTHLLDSAAAGFGAGMMVTHLPLTILLSLLLNTAAVLLGSFLGRTLAKLSLIHI